MFRIPYLSLGIDGTHVRFEEAPRRIPEDRHNKQHYRNRKNFDSINLMAICNDKRFCFIDSRWPGSTHDSRVWTMSSAKPVIEEQHDFLLVGDSAYAISETLTKPFSEAEIQSELDGARRRRKVLFNTRLCGARTVMTENIFGSWKRRWPIVKNMRHHMSMAQKAIKATVILENICREWKEELPDDEEEDDEDDPLQVEGMPDHGGGGGTVLTRGKAKRLQLLDAME